MKPTCDTCSHPHPRCHGHKDGLPCGRWPTRGATVCRSHGAGNPKVRALAVVREEASRWGLDGNTTTVDPGETMLILLTQSYWRANRYAAEIERLVGEHDTLSDALVGEQLIFNPDTGALTKVSEYIKGMAVIEAQERDRAARFAKMAIEAGLAERTVRLAERQTEIAERALLAALDDLGLDGAQQQRAVARLVHHLQLVG